MAYDKCFDQIITEFFTKNEAGELIDDLPFDTKTFKADLNARAERYVNTYMDTMKGEDLLTIQKKAHRDALDDLLQDMKSRQYQLERQAVVQQNLLTQIKNSESPTASLISTLKQADIEGENIYRAAMVGPLSKFGEEFASKIPSGIDLFFRRNDPLMRDVVTVIGGGKSNSKLATGYGKAIKETRELLLNEMEKLGYRVNRIDGYDIPHKWSREKVRKLGREAFLAKVSKAIDINKTRAPDGSQLTQKGVLELLDKTYDRITTGRITAANRPVSQITSVADHHNRMRSLHFKTSDDWLELHELFGEGSLFSVVDEQLQSISKDLGILKKLGPNARATYREAKRLVDEMRLNREGSAKFEEGLAVSQGADNVFAELTGDVYRLSNPNSSFSKAAADINSAVNSSTATAVHLGFSVFTALIDQANVRAASKVLGLNYSRVLGNTLKEFAGFGATAEGKRLSKTFSGIIDDVMSGKNLNGRFEDMTTYGTFSKVMAGAADFVVRATFLHRWTRIQKEALGRMINAEIAMHASKQADELPGNIKALFSEAGVSLDVWNDIRSSVVTVKGTAYIDPDKLLKKNPSAAGEFFGIISENVRYGVAEPGIETKAALHRGQKPDTLGGFATRAFAGLKSFTVSNTMNHLRRMFLDERQFNRFSYFAGYSIYGTMLAAMSVQLAQVARGREMFDAEDPELWGRAIGKASIFGFGGDMLDAAIKDRKPITGLAQFAVPGLAAYLDLFSHLGRANLNVATGDKKERQKAFGDILQGFSRLPPSNLWYAQLITKRLFWDQLQKAADPKAAQRARKARRRSKRETKPTEWWEYGETSPR